MADGIAEIVLVGASGSGKWALQSALVAPSQPGSNSQKGVREAVSWPIDNKYYSVETRMRVVQADAGVAASGQVPDAVLLVINATQPETFTAVQAWNAANDSEDAGVRLVVATHADCLVQQAGVDQTDGTDLEPARPPWLEQAMEWSAEQQFEYVECCCTDAEVDARLRLFGDVQGMQRITSALHAHMWPGLIRKPPASAAPSTTDSSTTASALPPAQPKDSEGGPDHAVPGTQEPVEHFVPAAVNGRKHHEPEEAQVEAYEKLMEEMAGAKRSLSMCDDATRRQRAAELALRFAALLGDDSSDVPTDASDAEEE